MTEALRIGLSLSVAVHLLALILLNAPEQVDRSADHALRIDIADVEALSVAENGSTLAVQTFVTTQGTDEAKLAQKRRKIYLDYLDAVSAAVHGHRLDTGDASLIGIAGFSFVIDVNGRFSSVTLRKSSGDPKLDAAAERAIRAASGEVKRPKVLGDQPMTVFEEVRYQYGLR